MNPEEREEYHEQMKKAKELKRKVEESNKIGCQNTTLKLINIRGLTKTKTMEVEKLMNDHTL